MILSENHIDTQSCFMLSKDCCIGIVLSSRSICNSMTFSGEQKNKFSDCYYLEHSDYWLHLYTHNILAFFRCFMSNSGINTESQTEPFIWTTGQDYSNFVSHDQVQVLSYSKYSLLFLPVVGIEPATSRWFHSALSNQKPYPLCHVFCWIFWNYKYLMSPSTHEILLSTIISNDFVP